MEEDLDIGFDMFDDSYRKAHQEFVSHHNGTSAIEILAISLCPHFGVIINGLSIVLVSAGMNNVKDNGVVSEFVATALPSLLCLTCCSESWELVLASLAGIALMLLIGARKLYLNPSGSKKLPPFKFLQIPASRSNKPSYVTNYRSSMLFITALCILAVDFPVFPRRFAKAENFGFGLMDIGVGSFVFSTGLLSLEARRGPDWISGNRFNYVKKAIKEVIPMIILGFVRLVAVKSSGYQEHISEYGLHWNFFFTLAVVKVISSVIFFIGFPAKWSWFSALVIIASHEISLGIGTGKWILEADNDAKVRQAMDLVSANREGLVSSIGFLAIYMAGVSSGIQILKPKNIMRDLTEELKSLILWSVLMWGSLYYSKESLFMPPSRRFANWSYFNWMVAYNLTLLTLFLTCDLVVNFVLSHFKRKFGDKKSKGQSHFQLDDLRFTIPLVHRSISRNSLGYFMLANLLTGAINMTMKTVYINGCPAILIIACYLLVLQVVAVVLFKTKTVLKPF